MSRIIRIAPLISLLALGCDPGTTEDPIDDTMVDDTMVDDVTLPEGVTCDDTVCRVTGEITESFTMTADIPWLLQGGVFIGDDVNETVLTIEPGTTIFGESSTDGFLVIQRGSKIMAEGTADAPIVFTSSKSEGSRARGDWGGLVVNGRGLTNACPDANACDVLGEGGTGTYGGNDDTDNSGALSYVRVEFAGTLVDSENELNGIAFQAVGSGTQLDHIQVHMNADDGVEFFGGTAEISHLLVTGVGDDLLDWTDGWRGKAQFVVLQNFADAGDNGIEADNNGDLNDAEPRSNPTIANMTIIGALGSDNADAGMLLREGTAGAFSHMLVTGWGEACVDIDHAETFANAWDTDDLSGELTIENSLFDCDTPFPADDDDGTEFTVEDFATTLNTGNLVADAGIIAPHDETSPDFRLDTGSAAWIAAPAFGGDFFVDAEFIGAMGDDDWTAGWTTSAAN